jgi:hypothetical protein
MISGNLKILWIAKGKFFNNAVLLDRFKVNLKKEHIIVLKFQISLIEIRS